MRNIDRLNQLLQGKAVVIPDFRRTVSDSLSNLKWLRKALAHRNETEELREINRILLLNPKEMFDPYQQQELQDA